MTTANSLSEPKDAKQRRRAKPVICYEVDTLPPYNADFYEAARKTALQINEVIVPPRDGRCFEVPKGHFFRIESTEGSQVGDLNLWQRDNLNEKFFSGKTRQLHASHVTTGDRLWSVMPYLRPLATITADTLGWYGWDDDGAGVHDVIGTRCDPYTNYMLKEADYDYCCHSNLIRALATYKGISATEAEKYVHDVMNVFMCTGFTKDTNQYFMKASPVRPGDYIEFFAETDLLGGLSACPGGDCGSSHSDDETTCYPLLVKIYKPDDVALGDWQETKPSGYGGKHALG